MEEGWRVGFLGVKRGDTADVPRGEHVRATAVGEDLLCDHDDIGRARTISSHVNMLTTSVYEQIQKSSYSHE